jgi:hypothetical protein
MDAKRSGRRIRGTRIGLMCADPGSFGVGAS